MSDKRKGEDGPVPFRSGRLFSVGTDWYFFTREGQEGPFSSRADAEAELSLFLRERNTEHDRIGEHD